MSSLKIKSHGIRRKKSPLKRLLNRHMTLLVTLVTLFASWFFLNSSLWEKTLYSTEVKENIVVTNTYNPDIKKNKTDLKEINNLTKQLLTEQQKTQRLTLELNKQSIELKDLLKKAIVKTKTKTKDKKYLDALNKIGKHKKHEAQTTSMIGQTDYYNKVRVSLSTSPNGNRLQNKVNSLIEHKLYKKGNEVKYFKNLTKESEVRRNEVRSIILKKGDTLWSLSKRAYGKGSLYPKILKANPQITKKNIRQLQIGTEIRVPV